MATGHIRDEAEHVLGALAAEERADEAWLTVVVQAEDQVAERGDEGRDWGWLGVSWMYIEQARRLLRMELLEERVVTVAVGEGGGAGGESGEIALRVPGRIEHSVRDERGKARRTHRVF